MARGWESKSVESQMDDAKEAHSSNSNASITQAEKVKERDRQVLLLARARVLQQIAASTNERYTESRRAALRELEDKIAELENGA
jgi:hypothetical protein